MSDKLKARALEWLRNETKYGTEARYASVVLQIIERTPRQSAVVECSCKLGGSRKYPDDLCIECPNRETSAAPEELRKPTALVATHESGSLAHFSKEDGWQVDAVQSTESPRGKQ